MFNNYHGNQQRSLMMTTESDVKLESIIDFSLEGLPAIVAPLCYDGMESEIPYNSPVWVKESTLLNLKESKPNSQLARTDLIDAYWKVNDPTMIGKMSILLDDTTIYVSYPNELNALMGEVECNPTKFVQLYEESVDKKKGYFP